jgi:ParB family transcriptional regulator, chromosome partitioning protein
MNMPALDLSGLKGFRLSETGAIAEAASDGKPLMLAVNLIDADPDNARTEISEESVDAMAESIRASGVLEPISVRRNGEHAGRYIINSGERRWRGSMRAGKTEIPAFIDDQADEFGRFNVNEQRENLSPMDKARFYSRHAARGLSHADIGRKCSPSRSKAYITQHLALLKLPAPILDLYERDVCRNATALCELARLHNKNASVVVDAIAGIDEVTGLLLRELGARINAKPENDDDGGDGDGDGGEVVKANDKEPKSTPANLTLKIVVKHGGQRYRLVGKFTTTVAPETPGYVFIAKGKEEPIEVDAAALELDTITVSEG